MKKFNTTAAQGELHFARIASLPNNAELAPMETIGGDLVVGHSETGHHHVIEAGRATIYRLPEDWYDMFLVVDAPASLRHQRCQHTHETIQFEPGVYRLHKHRQYTPDGWQHVID